MNNFSTSIYLPHPKLSSFNTLNNEIVAAEKETTKKKKKLAWSQAFLRSPEWRALRAEFLSESIHVCVHCGAVDDLQVDHKKPKSKYRELALDKGNLQILCWTCNRKKCARDVK
jgi:5-methylcytosine-specific restriction endonuclease McrA